MYKKGKINVFLKTERFFLFRMPSFCLCRCCSSFLSLWLHATAFPPEKLQLFAIFYVLHISIKNPHLLLICHSTEFLFTLSLSLSLPLLLLLLHLHGADQRSLLYCFKATPVRGLVSSCLDGWVIPTAPVPAGDRQTFSDCGHCSPTWIGSTDRSSSSFLCSSPPLPDVRSVTRSERCTGEERNGEEGWNESKKQPPGLKNEAAGRVSKNKA